METQHTPGPWHIAENKLSVVRQNQITYNMDIICHAKNNADAKVIASAPDLLHALQEIASRSKIGIIKKIAKDAIAKAKAQ